MIKIIGTMLCGGNREALIADALRSCVGNVDYWALIDTGESARRAIDVATKQNSLVPQVVWKFPDEYMGDAAAGRNFGLECANHVAHSFFPNDTCYAMVLDTDERMIYDGVDIREALAVVDTEVVEVMSRNGEYPKVRFIKLPAAHQYVDPVHEQYADAESISMLNRVAFWETERSKAEQDQKMQMVLDIALNWTHREPRCSRAWMHVGNADIYFGRYREAKSSFKACAVCSTHDEERAWALFRAAECANELDHLRESIELCARSLVATPYFPEPCCLAALASYKLDRPFDAMAWAQLAIVLGETSPIKRITPMRTGFRLPRCHYEMPWDLRSMALDCLVDKGLPGIKDAYDQAIELRDKATALRESRIK